MQIATFKQMLMQGKAGKRICYFEGELALDRQFNADADACAKLAMSMYDLGLVSHFVKRENGRTGYWVVLLRKQRRTESRISFGDAEGIAAS